MRNLRERPAAWLWVVFVLFVPTVWAEAPKILSVQPVAKTVGLYEKFELCIDLDAGFTNPFDPEQIDVQAEFTAPSGKVWTVWGFYNPTSVNVHWMVRFAPVEIGIWHYTVRLRDSEGKAQSPSGSFTAFASEHHGFVKIAENQRYLCHTDGTSFYGVGLWYNDSPWQGTRGKIQEANLDNLKRRGVNFICTRLEMLETLATGLGRYDQAVCDRLDEVFAWCEERDIYVGLNLWFHNYISEKIWDSWLKGNPYKSISKMTDFYSSAEAWSYQEKMHRYVVARWGYSRALFLWFIVDEINGTDGWYSDRKGAENWCRKINAFLKANDPYGRPTTGTQSGGIKQWWPNGYKIFDIANREIYEAQGHPMPKSGKLGPNDESPMQFSYRNYATQTQKLWSGFDKPAMLGECGWDHTYYEPGMPGYLAMYHNALWVSLVNGACATPFWWSYSDWINDSVVTNQLLHFSQFVAKINFAEKEFIPAKVTAPNCDAWAMRAGSFVVGWVVNPRSSVANEAFTVSDLPDGAYELRLYRTWRGKYMDPTRVECRNGRLTCTIPELKTTRGHAAHIGNDIAFKIVPK
jgi:hypothetical protein